MICQPSIPVKIKRGTTIAELLYYENGRMILEDIINFFFWDMIVIVIVYVNVKIL